VCKQLNSKENMFYETIEKKHPELLGFMPKYIGVLNVTYRKEQKKRRSTVIEDGTEATINLLSGQSGSRSSSSKARDTSPEKHDAHRMISHSLQKPSVIPQVVLENNRHLIPESFFGVPRRSITPDLQRLNPSPPQRSGGQSDDEASGGGFRPHLRAKSSWGYTTVNEHLRDRVLREVFTPPVIHRHDRRSRTHHHRSLRKVPKSMQNDISSLGKYQNAELTSAAVERPQLVPRDRKLSQRHIERTHSEVVDLERLRMDDDNGFVLSRSADLSENDLTATVQSGRQHRRRHSGSGLVRKPIDVQGSRGDLEYHEEEAYRADGEDEVFPIDDVKKERAPDLSANDLDTAAKSIAKGEQIPTSDAPPENKAAPRLDPAIQFAGEPEPRNPETSLVQHDERVEHFLLLEDLTAGMQKPCVLDLKMGTRQYGVDATSKKQTSQRQKCKTTTSRDLGVRLCGMQVYNVREQNYLFQDKYYGRDIEAGNDFRNALARFFFDGIGYAEALKHIPAVLEKIAALDHIIRNLPGYRLYASSLLMIYDRGDADVDGKCRRQPGERAEDGSKIGPYPDVKFKIVDFANCVTAEDEELVKHKACPPHQPGEVDRGYLRGLRTLKTYFQKIFEELTYQRYVEKGEMESMAMMRRSVHSALPKGGRDDGALSDAGDVSV